MSESLTRFLQTIFDRQNRGLRTPGRATKGSQTVRDAMSADCRIDVREPDLRYWAGAANGYRPGVNVRYIGESVWR